MVSVILIERMGLGVCEGVGWAPCAFFTVELSQQFFSLGSRIC